MVRSVIFVSVVALMWGCLPQVEVNADPTDTTPPPAANAAPAPLLSAFFGLDNSMPSEMDRVFCSGAGDGDGLPIIFSTEIDVSTLQAGDIEVVTASGARNKPICLTMAPAIDPGELRTALLLGELGDANNDPPVRVEFVGNVLSADGTQHYQGATLAVTPLPEGPSIVLVEHITTPARWIQSGTDGGRTRGTGCPAEGTIQALRVVWSGGITKPGNKTIDDVERKAYRVTFADGSTHTPFALEDRKDGDNNHLLCLNVKGQPVSVSFPAGLVTDPNEDLNPETQADVVPRPASASMPGGRDAVPAAH